MRIALYCPIKPPHSKIATGDRTIARNLLTGISEAGHDIFLASSFIAYMKRPDAALLQHRKQKALAEAQRVIKQLAAHPPDIWLTYHPYDKAPDWIGPTICKYYNIPLITVEAARTGQPGFEAHRQEAQAGIKAADLHMVLKTSDRAYLSELLGSDKTLRALPPFIDPLEPRSRPVNKTPVMLAAGQMRPGKKLHNFKILADVLLPLKDQKWDLVLVGGGPEEKAVRAAFEPFGSRVRFTGQIARNGVLDEMSKADLFVWPGWREPIGMVYLESQSLGLPVAAFADMGVPLVVEHGRTGLLAPADNPAALSDVIKTLLNDSNLLKKIGNAGPDHIAKKHSLAAAGKQITSAFNEVLGARQTSG